MSVALSTIKLLKFLNYFLNCVQTTIFILSLWRVRRKLTASPTMLYFRMFYLYKLVHLVSIHSDIYMNVPNCFYAYRNREEVEYDYIVLLSAQEISTLQVNSSICH